MGAQIDAKLGYLTRADEEHAKDIDDLYRLLKDHMESEEKVDKEIRDKFVSIDKKLLIVGGLVVLVGIKDLPWQSIVSLLL